jgi:DNA-binding NarL/FixJ family response regulator
MTTEDRDRQLPSIAKAPHDSAHRPHPGFTVEESIVMRAFAAGKTDKQVRIDLHIPVQLFYRLRRNLMEKTGARDPIGLHVWALRQSQCGDSREAERNYKWRRPA